MKRALAILVLGALVLAGTGCRKKKVQAAPPPAVAPPVAKAPEPAPPEKKPEPTAESKPETPTLVVPPPKTAPKPLPPLPTPTPATQPEPETTAPKPPAPQMSPRLTPAEQVAYRQQTQEAIAVAEKNLQAVSKRKLSAAQQDIAGKVRGFLGQAQEAMAIADWVRALNLAQKAQLLSQELLDSGK